MELTRTPAGALVEADGGRASIFVLDGDVARRRDVQGAFIDGAEVALRAGLAPGTTVITAGAAYLDDGARVVIADP